MRYITFMLLATMISSLGINYQFASAEVTYRLDFEGLWTAASHPDSYPTPSAHFSPLIGGTHNDQVVFWEPGSMATPGIEAMAEAGSTFTFRNEVQAAINAGTASSVLFDSTNLFNLPNSVSFDFAVEASHPLVTLTTMIAPSPDWFIGVHGLSLRDEGNWLSRVEVDLAAYDAGTEDGETYSLSNPVSSPPQSIRRITSGLLGDVPPLGRFTFTLQPNGLQADFNQDGVVDNADTSVWQAGYGNFSDGSATIVDGDANGDGHVDGADFLLWQTNFGSSLNPSTTNAVTAVGSVPEPSAALLLLAGTVALFGPARSFKRHLG